MKKQFLVWGLASLLIAATTTMETASAAGGAAAAQKTAREGRKALQGVERAGQAARAAAPGAAAAARSAGQAGAAATGARTQVNTPSLNTAEGSSCTTALNNTAVRLFNEKGGIVKCDTLNSLEPGSDAAKKMNAIIEALNNNFDPRASEQDKRAGVARASQLADEITGVADTLKTMGDDCLKGSTFVAYLN